ncbi:esterase B1-like [Condylostylus longicornis]|uniref:esterase B1-like n=1 Tax=Condylostylus longicornis TaxID=2530218 RepID=UPI00244DFCDC|nr:esterase B1-like [Condylostylus longicornis]XP_055381823.1 esterase B1-like [Condylostylus longicornis]XP_055381824.1 esterase B1-like [Condylostylus longicornis]
MSHEEVRIEVTVKQGALVGVKNQLDNNFTYYSFKGIPYAKPPVGNLRFKPPQSLEKFNDNPIDCTKERSPSFQTNMFTKEFEGSEDCLYLNIYTPSLENNSNIKTFYPVMFWIHGGGFSSGSGNSDLYGPDYIIKENIVLVTINYRLGIFGFLSFPEGGISGNAGLKDQQMALKWIHENIKNFNGDPNNITLFGESAGAVCVHYHCLTETSRKYFRKAIIQSGTAKMHWALQEDPSYKARKLSELLGLKKSATDTEISEFLTSYSDIKKMHQNMYNVLSQREKKRDVMMPFRPSLEPYSADAMIICPFSNSIKDQNLQNLSIIFGCTSSEGMVILENEFPRLEKFNGSDYARWVPYKFGISESDSRFSKIINEIKTFYMKDSEVKMDNLNPFINYLSDIHFIYEFYNTIQEHIKYQPSSNLYAYKFSFVGELNLYKNLLGYKHLDGAAHADELFYIFKQTLFMNYDLKPETREDRIVQTMCRMWMNFAKYGNPTPSMSDVIDFKWDPVGEKNNENGELNFLEINDRLENQKYFWGDRIKFWKDMESSYLVRDNTFSKL